MAAYIAKNNELNQEFFYPWTKIWLNNIFNTSFYGAPLWDLFNRDFEKLEKSWNTSQRIMMQLPRETHRYFLEPLSRTTHIIKSLKNRFINFVVNLKNSQKEVLRCTLREIQNDCRSITGRNLRKLRLKDGVSLISRANRDGHPYNDIPKGEEWKIRLVEEMINVKSGLLHVNQLTSDEMDVISKYVCCTWTWMLKHILCKPLICVWNK